MMIALACAWTSLETPTSRMTQEDCSFAPSRRTRTDARLGDRARLLSSAHLPSYKGGSTIRTPCLSAVTKGEPVAYSFSTKPVRHAPMSLHPCRDGIAPFLSRASTFCSSPSFPSTGKRIHLIVLRSGAGQRSEARRQGLVIHHRESHGGLPWTSVLRHRRCPRPWLPIGACGLLVVLTASLTLHRA